MTADVSELASRLAEQAEAVCRHYLSNGRRVGNYWIAGDVHNAPGRSMFVRLTGPRAGKGAAGKWTDAATGEHGDLLDVIGASIGFASFREVANEARRLLGDPRQEDGHARPVSTGGPHYTKESARRLFVQSQPIGGTLAARYLAGRGVASVEGITDLRFLPDCRYRTPTGAVEIWPAMIAAVTDLDGTLTGVLRTFLMRDGTGKAPVETPRRALGDLRGQAVRFGPAANIMLAGEGIETVLSVRHALPNLSMLAALAAGNLASLLFPTILRRLYIARDNDAAGHSAAARLADRAQRAGIEAIVLSPGLGDFNDDLQRLGIRALQALLRSQLAPQDVARFF